MFANLRDFLLDRAREPSTWAGMGPLLTAIGWNISPGAWESISFVCMGACGLLAIILKDKAS